jgi:hypothetical protein
MTKKNTEQETATGREASDLDVLVSEPTIDYVAKVASMANRIKLNQLREKLNHKIPEGDVWAIIGAVRELGQAH